MVPASSWLVARSKLDYGFKVSEVSRLQRKSDSPSLFAEPHSPNLETLKPCHLKLCFYALRLGRTVKSRTCIRMLDICIPFSCETNGRISATN
jgi:hypothetical protein